MKYATEPWSEVKCVHTNRVQSFSIFQNYGSLMWLVWFIMVSRVSKETTFYTRVNPIILVTLLGFFAIIE